MIPTILQHEGYTGSVVVDLESKLLHGRVIGLRDVITFQGKTVEEAEQAFRESVDDYLEFCKARGERPEKPYSGKFLLRIKPELHRALAMLAEAHEQSLNATVEQLLEKATLADRFTESLSGFDIAILQKHIEILCEHCLRSGPVSALPVGRAQSASVEKAS